MINKQIVILFAAVMFSVSLLLFPPRGFTKEKATIEGMVQIDKNHLYMIAVGADVGLRKGDMIEIYRLDVKVGDARLISVLPDSSMAQMTTFINVIDIYESDTVHYTPRITGVVVEKTLSSIPTVTPVVGEAPTVDTPDAKERKDQRGLLGSDKSVQRQVQLARRPLQEEVRSLKVGMETVRQEYREKISAVLQSDKGSAVKWKKKFEKLSDLRSNLEEEYAREKEELQWKIALLTKQISEADSAEDLRTQQLTDQLMSDLEKKENTVNMLREAFEKERVLEEGQWTQKMEKLEQAYQNQLIMQKKEFDRELTFSRNELLDKITNFKDQILALQGENKKQVNILKAQRKARRNIADLLEKEKLNFEENLNKKNEQIVRSKKAAIDLQDKLATTKSGYSTRIKDAKRPLETKIRELTSELASLRKTSEIKLSNAKEKSKTQLSAALKEQAAKLTVAENKYQSEIKGLTSSSQDQIRLLQSSLKDREEQIVMFERNADVQVEKFLQNEKEIKQLRFNVKTLKNELQKIEDSRDADIETATRSLEDEVARMKSEITFLADQYEEQLESLKHRSQETLSLAEEKTRLKIEGKDQRYQKEFSSAQQQWEDQFRQFEKKAKEDESLIKFLNAEMATLTNDQEKRDQKLAQLEKMLSATATELGKVKTSQLNKTERATRPLNKKIEELSEQITVLRSDSDRTITRLKDQLKGQETLVSTLKKKNSGLSSDLHKKDNQLAKLEDSFNRLNLDHVKVKSNRSEKIRSAKSPLEEKIRELNIKLDFSKKNYDEQIEDLQEETSKKLSSAEQQWQAKLAAQEGQSQQKMDELAKQITVLKNDSDSTIAQLQDQLTEKEARVSSLGDKNFSLNSELQKKDDQISLLEGNIAQINETRASVEREWKATLASQEEQSQQKMDELAKQITVLQNDSDSTIAQLQDQITEKEARVSSLGDKNSSLNSELHKKDDRIILLESNIAQMNETRASVEREWKATLASQEEQSQQKMGELAKQISALRSDSDGTVEGLMDRIEQKEFMISSQQSQINDFTSSLKRKNNQLAELEDSIAQLNSEFSETKLSQSEEIRFAKLPLEEKIHELNNELTISKKKSEGQIKEIQEIASDHLSLVEAQWKVKLASQENELQKTIEDQKKESKGKIEELEKLINTLQKDSDSVTGDLRAQVKKRESMVSSLEIKMHDLNSDLQKKNDQLAKLESSMNGLISDLSKTKSTQTEKIRLAKLPLKKKINELNDEILSLKKGHEDQIEDMERKVRNNRLDYEAKSQKKFSEREVEWEDKAERLRDQFREEVAALNEQLRIARDGGDYQKKNLEEELQKEKRTIAQLKMEATNMQLDLSERDRQLAKAKDSIEDLKGRLQDDTFSNEKRIALAKESMSAEIEMLKSELAFAKDNHEDNTKFIKERAANDLRIAQEKAKAELGASEARWKVKWATREEEFRKEHNLAVGDLEKQLSGNRGDLRKTIASLNDRLNMLKDSSENQIKELEDELSKREYLLSMKGGEFQKRLTGVESQWAAKLAEEQRKNRAKLGEQKQIISEDFLNEKKELRQTIVDLTEQFQELRDKSAKRIKELETDLDKREYKLGFIENHSEQNTFEIEEKWQAKLTAAKEQYRRELADQKRAVEERFARSKKTQATTINDLSNQIETLKEQFRVDLNLREEELKSEIAIHKAKYEKELTRLRDENKYQEEELKTEMAMRKVKYGKELMDLQDENKHQIKELADKIQFQKNLIDSLERKKSDLTFDLQQKEREIVNTQAIMENLKKETRMAELSQSEKLRLSRDSLQAKIDELALQLTVAKSNAAQEKMDLEDRWKVKFVKVEEDYAEKLENQRKSLEREINNANNRLDMSRDSMQSDAMEMQNELHSKQTLIQLLSREKFDLSSELEIRNRENIRLNEEIIGLEESLEKYRNVRPDSIGSFQGRTLENESRNQASSSKNEALYNQKTISDKYYSVVRKAILSKFQEFDFSAYAGKEGVVKIDFELSADGSPASRPEFFGTKDEGLKNLLMQCFKRAAPFPPFPKNLKKRSQRFALSVSFKK